jgi:hypothetical protein
MTTLKAVPALHESRLARLMPQVLPWLAFAAVALWGWGFRDLAHTLPHYGDFSEHIAGVQWFGEALSKGLNPLVYPLNFFPEGWQLGAHPGGPILYVLLWPLAQLNGPALALNLGMLLGCVLAFQGVRLLARPYLSPFPATIAALAFTFWPLRWHMVTDGLFNIQISSALLPWLAWCVDQAFVSPRRRLGWLALGGALWALAIMSSMYFAFVGGVVLLFWFWFSRAGEPISWRMRVGSCLELGGLALLISAPWLYINWRANALTDPDFYKIVEVNLGGTSINALVAPFLLNPWLHRLARWIYPGPAVEQAVANFGIVGTALAVAGGVLAVRRRAWWPALALALALVFALGLTLQWNGQTVQVPALQPLNALIWRAGHLIKPAFFVGTEPPKPFAEAVPLPSLWLSVIVPIWERGRQFVRYALGASLGVYLLAALALARLRRPWLRYLLAGLLMFELLPVHLAAQPYPPEPHPAFTWLAGQDLGGQGIVEFTAGHPYTPVLATGGPILLATRYHHQATVAGASGVTPRQHAFLGGWLSAREHSYWDPDFAPILRAYRVKYILLHMQGADEQGIWKEMLANKELQSVRCFEPSAQPGPWPWPICIAEVLPAKYPNFNMLLHDGWSGMEDWGVWMEGTTSQAQFISTAKVPYRLTLAAFPQCAPDRKQQITIKVQGTVVAGHEWQNCDPWEASVEIPASLVKVGANDLVVNTAYALSPADLGKGEDVRRLSAGFTRLRAERADQH